MNETLNGFARLVTVLVMVDGALAYELVEALQQRVPAALQDLARSRDSASDQTLTHAIHEVLERYAERVDAALGKL